MKRFNSYEEFLLWLYNLKKFGINYSVENIRKLLNYLGNPESKLTSILITGSGGKGSTVAILSYILKEAGYKVGIFIKPHLHRYTERISINFNEISKERLIEIANFLFKKINEIKRRSNYYPTFFEVTTAISILYFFEENVDICVYEVGIGGRYDSTNVLNSIISCITTVYLEHTNILGKTIKEIAWNKAGIIKRDGYLITSETKNEALEIIKKECVKNNSEIFLVKNDEKGDIKYENVVCNLNKNVFNYYGIFNEFKKLETNLLGDYQQKNSSIAIACAEILNFLGFDLSFSNIKNGLLKIKWPGRLEIFNKNSKTLILDCAKDPFGMKELINFLKKNIDEKFIIILSISNDKNYKDMLKHLIEISDNFILSKHKVMGRAIDNKILAQYLKKLNKKINFYLIDDVKEALNFAINLKDNKPILVTGSLFTVSEAREILVNEEVDKLNVSDPSWLK